MSLIMKNIDTSRLQVVIKEENKNVTVGNIIGYNPASYILQKIILANYTDSLEIYAPDGVTLVAKIDSNGNLGIKGQIYTI